MKLKRKTSVPEGRHRNRNTPVDQSSPAPYSYRSRRSEESFKLGRGETARQKISETTHSGVRKLGLIILLIAIVISLIKILSLSATPDLRFVGSSSNNALISSNGLKVYTQAAKDYLSSSIWNANKLTVNSNGLASYLYSKYPELAAVTVSVPFIDNHLVIHITPTQPALILVEPSAAYAIDESGRAILSAKSAAGINLKLPIVTDQSGLEVGLGKKAITSSDVYFIEEVSGQLQAKHFSVSGMTLPANTDELDVSLAGQPYFIKFNLYGNDPRQQAGTFLAVITKLKAENITPSKYVDVRVDGRAYYQ
ncbi:MAG TPA: hypothetical protein VFN31_01425 [Candidatus Saccharimonadales bacterium]|nr:hypothetical protein [Candidatus Saccharimonadales bacterium]